MRETVRILELWAAMESAGQEGVLATVVKTQGSSYRLPGARLLLAKDGRRAGSISGGCLEDDVVKKAWWLTEKGPVVRRYDTTADNEIAAGGFGLGCNGIVHLLLERVTAGEENPLSVLRQVRVSRESAAIAHMLEPAGQRLTLTWQAARHNLTDSGATEQLAAEARDVLSTGRSRLVRLESGREVFVETIAPPVRLLVFGAGDDAIPLAELAGYLGWDVLVFDGRAHYARRERFPQARAVKVRITGDALPEIDPWTVAVLMSHSYSQDLTALRDLAPLPLPYLGVLGPQKRTLRLFEDAGLDLGQVSARIHGPMGLDIGADGPEQVALAVVSEIQARLNGREGGPLYTRHGSIHARDESGAWVQSIVCA